MSTASSDKHESTSSQPATQPQVRPPRFRIENRLIYWGIVVLMASALLWLGAELARRIEWFLPYAGGFGLAMIAAGYFLEIRKSRRMPDVRRRPEDTGGAHPRGGQNGLR